MNVGTVNGNLFVYLCIICNTSEHIAKFVFAKKHCMIYLLKESNLTNSSALGKSGIAAGWKALRALSDDPRQAHVILYFKNRAKIL